MLLIFALLLIAKSGLAFKSDDDDDDDVMDTIGVVVDCLNVLAFVLAGGPEEVMSRLLSVVAFALVTLAVAAGCQACCGSRPARSRSSFDRAVEWGARGACSYYAGTKLYDSRSKWGL